jgi:hypothetical protein
LAPSYDVKDVLVVFAVSCEENAVLVKEAFTEDGPEAADWKERAMLRDGFLNGIGEDMKDLTGCFPFKVFVNFGDFSKWLELSGGLFLVMCKETCLLA